MRIRQAANAGRVTNLIRIKSLLRVGSARKSLQRPKRGTSRRRSSATNRGIGEITIKTAVKQVRAQLWE